MWCVSMLFKTFSSLWAPLTEVDNPFLSPISQPLLLTIIVWGPSTKSMLNVLLGTMLYQTPMCSLRRRRALLMLLWLRVFGGINTLILDGPRRSEAWKNMECCRLEEKDRKPWGPSTGWEKDCIGESLIHQMEGMPFVLNSSTQPDHESSLSTFGKQSIYSIFYYWGTVLQMSEGKPVFYDKTKWVDLRGFWEEFFGDWIGRFFHFVYASTLTLLIPGEKDTLETDTLAVLPSFCESENFTLLR